MKRFLFISIILVFLTCGCSEQETLHPAITVIVITATPESTMTPFPTINAVYQATALAQYAIPTPTTRPGYPTPVLYESPNGLPLYKQGDIWFYELYINQYVIRRWINENNFVTYTISSINQDEIQTPATSTLPESGGGLDALTGMDITGEGDPDLILHVYTGGNHCCNILQIYNLGKTVEMVFELNTSARSGTFVDLDNDGVYEYVTYDPTFEYANFGTGDLSCSFANSPYPMTIFQYSPKNGYTAANLKFADRYKESIALHAKLIENYLQDPSTATKSQFSICDISYLVLDYLYSGQTEKAWETLYKIYPAEVANQYKMAIERKLENNVFFEKP